MRLKIEARIFDPEIEYSQHLISLQSNNFNMKFFSQGENSKIGHSNK